MQSIGLAASVAGPQRVSGLGEGLGFRVDGLGSGFNLNPKP